MPTFHYRVVNSAGEVIEGTMDGGSQALVVQHLQAQGNLPLQVDEVKAGTRVRPRGGGLRLFGGRAGVSQKDVGIMTQELASLLAAGLPLDRALTIMQEIGEQQATAKLLSRIQEEVRGGASLADAMEAQGNVFSRFYLNMVRAGEAGGSVDVALNRLTEFLERSRVLRETITSALVYPIILVLVAVGSVMLLLIYVVPQFKQMFEDSGAALPFATQVVIASGEFLQSYWWTLLLGVLAVALLMRQQLTSPNSRYRWHGRFLRMPLVGELVSKVEMARFARTLGTLVHNGVPLLTALVIVKETLTNQVLSQGIATAAESLKEGQGLSGPLMDVGLFPALAVHMIRVGEETGQMEEMLLRVATTYDNEVQSTTKRFLALLEPVLILGLGTLVAGIIISILVAIIGVNDLAAF